MQSTLCYHDSLLYIENVSLEKIANQYGTPSYIYSRTTIENNWRQFDESFGDFPHQVCYAVKANSNIAILNLLVKLHSFFDIVSVGELVRVLAAGGKAEHVIFSGVGKSAFEIEFAIQKGVYCFNVESVPELERLEKIASQLQKKINIALRVNPNVDPDTHNYISTGLKENKFGIELDAIISIVNRITEFPSLNMIGLACHIGSQILSMKPFSMMIDKMLILYQQIKNMGICLDYLDFGGGLGIHYQDEKPPAIKEYVDMIKQKMSHYPVKIMIEPGRAIVGEAGVLLTRVEYIKETSHKKFAIVDAGMNDLLRPALYSAWQPVFPVIKHHDVLPSHYDIVGPVCESADFLAKNRQLTLYPNDLLAIDRAGAYGFSMSSNYNSRCLPAELLVDRDTVHLIRRRQTLEEMIALEKIIGD